MQRRPHTGEREGRHSILLGRGEPGDVGDDLQKLVVAEHRPEAAEGLAAGHRTPRTHLAEIPVCAVEGLRGLGVEVVPVPAYVECGLVIHQFSPSRS